MIQIFSACLGAAGGVQPGRDDGGQHVRNCDNLPLQGEDQDKIRQTVDIEIYAVISGFGQKFQLTIYSKFCDFVSLDCNY